MRKIRMQVQYIGKNYSGWQWQKNSISVQQLIEDAITKITGEKVTLHGAGRTDAGVHAFDQRALFTTSSTIPARRFATAINSVLPNDIRIQNSEESPSGWHPRFTPHQTTYRYTIETASIVSPFLRDYTWHKTTPLNLNFLNSIAKPILGNNNFLGFSGGRSTVKNHVRCITESQWTQEGTRFIYQITGNGFLYHMVRLLVGYLMEICSGKRKPEDLIAVLDNPMLYSAKLAAPAQGLCLYKIVYEDSIILLDNLS